MISQGANIVNFFTYLVVAIPLMVLGIYVFLLTTPYKEFEIISEGAQIDDPQKVASAKACAHDVGGKGIGLALVLASAIFHAVNILDLIIWGLIGITAQVAVFYLFELFTRFKVIKEIPKGNVAVGVFSSYLSVTAGLLIAALISY